MRIIDWSSDVCSSDLELALLSVYRHGSLFLPSFLFSCVVSPQKSLFVPALSPFLEHFAQRTSVITSHSKTQLTSNSQSSPITPTHPPPPHQQKPAKRRVGKESASPRKTRVSTE